MGQRRAHDFGGTEQANDDRVRKATFLAAFITETRLDRTLLFTQPEEDADEELARERRRREVERAAGVRTSSTRTWDKVAELLDRMAAP